MISRFLKLFPRPAPALALCLALAAFARAQAPESVPLDAVVARVNGEPIFFSQLKEAALDLDVSLESLSMVRPSSEGFRAAVTALTDEELLVQAAKREEVAVDDVQVGREVAGMLQTLKARVGGEEQLNTFLARRGLTLDELRNSLTRHEERKSLATAAVIRRVHIDDGMLRDFEARCKKEGRPLVLYKAAQVFYDCPAAMQGTRKGKDLYQKVLEDLPRAAGDQEKFMAFAARRSEDAGARENGGLLGWLDPAKIDPKIAEKLKSMSIGQVSTPVATEKGYHVLMLLDQRTTRDLLFTELFEQKRVELTKQLRSEATIRIFDLEALRRGAAAKAAAPAPGKTRPQTP